MKTLHRFSTKWIGCMVSSGASGSRAQTDSTDLYRTDRPRDKHPLDQQLAKFADPLMTFAPSVSPTLTENIVSLGTLPSWNPIVPYKAVLVTVEAINGPATRLGSSNCSGCLDTSSIPTGGVLATGYQYPTDWNDILNAQPWDGQRRTFTPRPLVNGKGTFVEIDGVAIGDQATEDFRTFYHTINFANRPFPNNPDPFDANKNPKPSANAWGDTTFSIFNPVLNPNNCPSTSRMHCEIDGDWSAFAVDSGNPNWDAWQGHVALRDLAFGTLIDLQGFVFWDPEHTTECFHSFSGWELHPVTAWRVR